jgi:outer membrane lipoprotein-sorting protein
MIGRLTIGLLLLAATAAGQPSKGPTAVDVLRNVERAFNGVNDFSVTVIGDVNMESLRVPRMTATMYYKRPDKVHFASTSFTLLPREGMSPNPERWLRDYDATLAGRDTVDGRPAIKLQLAARDATARLRQVFLWVDPSQWTILRLASMPREGRTITFDFVHALVDGRFWLPQRLTAMFGTVGEKTEPMFKVPDGAPNPAPQVNEMQRSLRAGSVTFTYQDYRLNTGLPDSLFEAKELK